MDFLNKIKGAASDLLFEDDGSKPSATPTPVAAPSAAKLGGVFAMAPQVNADMVAAIRKVTFGRNTAFTALHAAADALVDIIPDPTMRLKAAQKTAGGGRGAKEITEAIGIHLNDVDGEERRFQAALDSKVQAEVGNLKLQAERAASVVTNSSAEIQKLQARITELTSTISEQTAISTNLEQEAALKEAELLATGKAFQAAAQAVRDELNAQKASILSVLS